MLHRIPTDKDLISCGDNAPRYGVVLCAGGQYDSDQYFAENLRHAELHGVSPEVLMQLRHTFATERRSGLLKLVLQQASKAPQAFPAMQLSLFHGEAGNMDQAFQFLDRAFVDHDPSLVHLAVAPQWDPLRGDPRFTVYLTRMG